MTSRQILKLSSAYALGGGSVLGYQHFSNFETENDGQSSSHDKLKRYAIVMKPIVATAVTVTVKTILKKISGED